MHFLLVLSLAAIAAEPPQYPLLQQVFSESLTAEQRESLGAAGTLEQAAAAMTPEQRESARGRLAGAEASAKTPAELKEIARGYLILEGRAEQAAALAARAQELEPSKPEGYALQAGALYQTGDYPAAVSAARKALQLDPNEAAAIAVIKLSEGRVGRVKLDKAPPSVQAAGPSAPADDSSLPYKPVVRMSAPGTPPAPSLQGPSAEPKEDVPPLAPWAAGALAFAGAAYGLYLKGKEKLEPYMPAIKTVAAAGLIATGVGGMIYGGTLLAGSIALAPTLAGTATVVVNGAVAAKGAAVTAVSAAAVWQGGSMMMSSENPTGGSGGGGGGSGSGHKYSGKTVEEILKGKRGNIKSAPLEKGSPSWNDIMKMKWEEIAKGAQSRKTGYETFKKLLTDKRFDKP